jgi:transposase-like protein
MPCPHCASPTTTRQHKTTALGYQTFRCAACRRSFNERTGTPFNFLEYPTDIVLLVVLWMCQRSSAVWRRSTASTRYGHHGRLANDALEI